MVVLVVVIVVVVVVVVAAAAVVIVLSSIIVFLLFLYMSSIIFFLLFLYMLLSNSLPSFKFLQLFNHCAREGGRENKTTTRTTENGTQLNVSRCPITKRVTRVARSFWPILEGLLRVARLKTSWGHGVVSGETDPVTAARAIAT